MIDEQKEMGEEASPEQQQAAQMEMARKYLSMVTEREKWLETHWWKQGKMANELYSQGEKDKAVYNILYSNTEVLFPSLYSATPRPDIRPRFMGAQLKPIPEVIERFLSVSTDSVQPGFESFDEAMEETTIGALIPGAGCIRIVEEEGQDFPLQYKSVCYNQFIYPAAKKWSKMPWIAFKHELPPEVLKKQMGLSEEQYSAGSEGYDDENKSDGYCVYEFWHKATRTVWFLCDQWREKVFKVSPDPFGLKGFYPTPGLLKLTRVPGKYDPVPLYEYYRNQAEELDRVTVRLNKVLHAIRVRGVYNTMLGEDMQNLVSDEGVENQLFPAADTAALIQQGGFEKGVWLIPIEKLIVVAQELYKAREAIKTVIYELTGISDIIRGSSVASETATAQNIKNKWGTVRLRKMQANVGKYVRDVFRLMVDAGTQVIPPEGWKQIVQLPIPLAAEKQAAKQQLDQIMQQAAALRESQMPPPGPPPDQQLMQTAQGPSWEEIIQQISSDMARTFTINIQTDSTIDSETATDKEDVQEYMTAMSQLVPGVQPLAQLGPSGLDAAKSILVGVSRRYKFGQEIAEKFEAVQMPQPQQQEDPKKQLELQLVKAEHEAKMAEIAENRKTMLMKQEIEREKLKLERERIGIEQRRAQIQLAAMERKAQIQMITRNTSQGGTSNADV